MSTSQVTIDGRRLTVAGALTGQFYGTAVLRPAGSSPALSQGRQDLNYGPSSLLSGSIRRNELHVRDQVDLAIGTVSLLEIPPSQSAIGNLPPDSRVGILEGQWFSAFAFFYRPLNRLSDVIDHFLAIAPVEHPDGMVASEGYDVVEQAYSMALDAGMAVLTEPQGTPSVSYTQVRAGRVWREGHHVYLEGDEVRLMVTPWAHPQSRDPLSHRTPSSDSLDDVYMVLSSIERMAWRG